MSNPTSDEEVIETGVDPLAGPGGLEREVLGKWTVFLRNLGGIIAVVVVCGMGLANCYTTFVSVADHQVWPSETSVFIMVVGPVVCAWTFMNSSKTISTIMQIKGVGTKLRNRAAVMLATEDINKNPPKQDGQQ